MVSLAKIVTLAVSQLVRSSETTSSHLLRTTTLAFSSQAQSQEFPEKCDVCIIGGGAMGSSSAFWLKRRPEGKNLKVIVIERDNKYTTASTVLSLGGIRQQFSNGENVQLSLFGSRFIKNLQDYLGIEGHPPVDVQYHPGGYLFLATNSEGAQILEENHAVQRQYDSKVELISKEKVKQLYPCLNVDDIVLGSIGVDNEGWFDPWSMLNGFKRKAISLGAQYVDAEVVSFDNANASSNAGPTRLKRYVYYLNAPELAQEKIQNLPYVIEPNGVYWRPDGSPGNFFAGRSPEECDEPLCENLDVDYSFFDTDVWPHVAHRAKAMENIKVKSAWGGYYDYNTFDQNGIIGVHPVFRNFYIATGFSGHGIQQSPAVGRAIMELILDGGFRTIDLKRFGFERLIRQERVLERNIV